MGYRTAQGKKFTVNSLAHSIRNSRYCGEYVVDGVSYPDRYPAIISKELFYKVQNILSLKEHANAAGKANSTLYLSGKAYCLDCGEKIVGTGSNKKGKYHHYYSCSGRYYTKTCDKATELKEDLEAIVSEATARFLSKPKHISALAALASSVYDQRLASDRMDSLKAEIEVINDRLKELTAAMVKTSVPSVLENIERECEELEVSRTLLEAELKRLYIVADVPHSKVDFENTLNAFAVNPNIKNPDYKQKLFSDLINSVFVSDTKALIFFSLFTNEKITLFPNISASQTTPYNSLYGDSPLTLPDTHADTQKASGHALVGSESASAISPNPEIPTPLFDTIPLPKGKVQIQNIIARQLHPVRNFGQFLSGLSVILF